MKLLLQRLYLEGGTLGALSFESSGFKLWTLEETFKGNEADSCVPEGRYELVPHSSARHPETWALVGETVSHYAAAGVKRSAILFHRGNLVIDTEGCILVGTSALIAEPSVLGSGVAFERFLAILRGSPGHSLTIQRG